MSKGLLHTGVKGRPFGQPLGGIAEGVCRVEQVHAECAAGHLLLDQRHLVIRMQIGSDDQKNRSPAGPPPLEGDHVLGGVFPPDLGKPVRKDRAERRLTGVVQHLDAPGADLAMIRNPDAGGEDFFQLGRIGARPDHILDDDGTAGEEQIDSFHGTGP